MKIFIPLAMWVGSAKKRDSLVPKAFGMRVEAFFCLDFFFLFLLRKKKAERLFED
jgi:hypothetical protein